MGDNVYIRTDGSRKCVECKRRDSREYYRRKAANSGSGLGGTGK